MTYQEQINNLKTETMEEIILFMIQVFKENANKSLTPDEVIKYYKHHKQLPVGVQEAKRSLKVQLIRYTKTAQLSRKTKVQARIVK